MWRVCSPRCMRIVADERPMCMPVVAGTVESQLAVWCWYLAPLGATFYLLLWKEVTIAQLGCFSLSSAWRCSALGTFLEQMLVKGACFL